MTDQTDPLEHVARNRAHWDELAAQHVAPGERAWADNDPKWGIWGIAEAEAKLLPDELDGLDVIELGCGTAYVGSWLARRGATVTGIDNSPVQLETAARLQREHDLAFPLHLGNAEDLPFEDASFDLAISEYGACLWADPYKWVPEAARVLRPGGRLIFLTNSALRLLCEADDGNPIGDRLVRSYFGIHRVEWSDDDSVEFHLTHGDWIELLRSNGFEVEALRELRPPEGATTPYTEVPLEWARRWPSEEAWIARLRPPA
jgi:SAM-dependent methyltransferase